MSLDNILRRRALRLKAELSESGNRPKPSLLSVIYPATDHGKNMPAVVKTPSSIPSPNDSSAKVVDDQPEKKEKEKDGPGTSKSPSFSVLADPGQSASVPDEHKRAAFELGYFGEGRSERFISRCVQLITGVTKIEQSDKPEPAIDVPPAPEASPSKSKLVGVANKFKKGKQPAGHD